MKRLVIVLIIIQIVQFVYIMGQIEVIRNIVSSNANTANERAQAFAKILIDQQERLIIIGKKGK